MCIRDSKEVERDLSTSYGGAQAIRRDAGRRETRNEPDPPHVARRKAVLGVGHDDPQLDQSAKIIGADACPLGGLG